MVAKTSHRVGMGRMIGADLTQTRNLDRSHLAHMVDAGVIDESNKVFYKTSGLGLKNSLSN